MRRSALNSTEASHVRTAVRVLAALLILFVGADHYWAYSVDQYSVLPTIGTLFLLNFISATVVGVALLTPLERIFRRSGRTVLAMAALSGFGIAATSLVALLVSEHTPLFGFMESNYRPAIIIAIASEAAAAASLVLLFALTITATRTSVTKPSRSTTVDPSRPGVGTT
jgi:hypothetical protein